MTDLRDKIAAVIWENEGACPAWVADAIIAALPGMVAPLVWHKSHMASWDGDYHTLPTGYTIRCADEYGYKWTALGAGAHGYSHTPEAAMLHANAHHAAAVIKFYRKG